MEHAVSLCLEIEKVYKMFKDKTLAAEYQRINAQYWFSIRCISIICSASLR